ncbi:ATP-dependent RNA helicase DDX42, partial [Fragariocoptes setiger]
GKSVFRSREDCHKKAALPRGIDDDEYFERDDDDETGHHERPAVEPPETTDSGDEDPLDAFMRQNDQKLESERPKGVTTNDDGQRFSKEVSSSRGVRVDIDEVEDLEESYYKFVAENPIADKPTNSNEDLLDSIEYDEDGNPLSSSSRTNKIIDPLPDIDHSLIQYEPFERYFYKEHNDIRMLNDDQVQGLREKLEIRVTGNAPPKPVCSFAHFNFDDVLMKLIRKSEYTQPTAIQAQAVPAALQGRNVIGIAMTGSGKTASYVWPLVVHVMGQPDLKPGDGPIGLILVPTRELALQVFSETKKFSKAYNIAVVCAYGGGSKWEQSRDCEAGAEIIVATPGRMIDLVKLKATNLRRVTYLVLDEADRMFDMGFEAQVTSICNHVRPDRQVLMFSATFKKKIERLARHFISDPIKIVQRELGEANIDVTQKVLTFSAPNFKWEWLVSRLVELMSNGSVLIFVTRKLNAEELHRNITELNHQCLLLHGDMDQSDRNRVITSFKRKEVCLMVATDVAARGLDISHVKTVINYDVARDIDTHVHRIGRTGRAGTKGTAYSLLTDADKDFAGLLVRNLESSNQIIPDELFELAMKSSWFKKSTRRYHTFKSGPRTSSEQHFKRGLGYRTSSHKRPKFGNSRIEPDAKR